MSQGNMTFTENFLFYGSVPALTDDGSVATAWIPAGNLINAVGYVMVGATDITVDAKWQSATDASGTGAADVTGAAITQLTALAGDEKQAAIELEIGKLATTRTHVQFSATAGNGSLGANLAVMAIGNPRRKPPTQPATLVEVVKVKG